MNVLKALTIFGQSIWLDYIKKDFIADGRLSKLIMEDDLRGITSNPSIFEKSIADSKLYDEDIKLMVGEEKNVNTIYETLTQTDVRNAADAFRNLYDEMDSKDGYVSLEVNPHLAHDTKGTIIEARRLWTSLARPNVLIKVPATLEGLPAIKQLISEGINVNVTLLFGLNRYRAVVEAYMAGLELRVAQGGPLKNITSVASFFLSRIDALIDPMLEKIIAQGGEKAILARKLQGQVATACAKMAYQIYGEIVTSDRFNKLFESNAKVQRLLWASTSTKNPDYSDIKYIEALIGLDTVNTVPLETLDAYRDHGNPQPRLEKGMDQANEVFQQLSALDINIDKLSQQLEDEGVEKFKHSFDQLIVSLEEKIKMEI